MLFRAFYMPQGSLGRNPERGYALSKTSEPSLIFFKWLNSIKKAGGQEPVKFAGNSTREIRAGRFYLDAIDEHRIYEYSG